MLVRKRQSRGWWRRVRAWIWQGLLWALTLLPGVILIENGLYAIRHKRMVVVYGYIYNRVVTGPSAVGEGWWWIAVGLAALGYFVGLKTGSRTIRLWGWGLAVLAGLNALRILIKYGL